MGRENDRANGAVVADPGRVMVNDRRQLPISLEEEGKFRETTASDAAERRGDLARQRVRTECRPESFSTSQS